MPDPPRRILEKSKTVRRRYQRSNKRFQFTASQIQQIEREEEREKRAQQLRDREKKKLANKKKRAEKEAQEREERKRLGLPHPNGLKITASQPLMLNFFGKKKEEHKEEEEEEEEKEKESAEPSVENMVDVPLQDTTEDKAAQPMDDDSETEFEDDWFEENLVFEEHLQCRNNAISKDVPVFHIESQGATPENKKLSASQKEVSPLYMNTNKIIESFEDDTAHLLEDLDPTTILQECRTPNKASIPQAMPSSNCTGAGAEPSETDDYKENWHPNFPRDGRQKQLSPQSAIPHQQSSPSQSSHYSGPLQVLNVLSSHGFDQVVAPEAISPGKYQRITEEPHNDHAESKADVPFDIYVDTEDEFGDLELSTQELRDIDDMTENNA